MKHSLRQSMSWLHTWSGLLLGWLLFVVFVTGSLSYFKTEITHWMTPEAHGITPASEALEQAVMRLQTLAPEAKSWRIVLPSPRQASVEVNWREEGERWYSLAPKEILDGHSGQALALRETAGGDFLYRFHFELHYLPYRVSRLFMEIAALGMLVALVSGVIMHRHLFAQFFLLRRHKPVLGWHDLHTTAAVLSWPFFMVMALSGALFFASSIVFWSDRLVSPSPTASALSSVSSASEQSRVEQPPAANWIRLLRQAEVRLEGSVGRVEISQPNSRHPVYEFYRTYPDTLTDGRYGRSVTYQSIDGLWQTATPQKGESSIRLVYEVLQGLHIANFAEPSVRWLLFLLGLSGALMIASGCLMWSTKRAKSQAQTWGFGLVARLNLATIGGLMLACAGYFWANRLLPATLEQRAEWEITTFFVIWGGALCHALYCAGRRAWQWQLGCAAALLILFPILDSFTSPVSLWQGIRQEDMIRLGVDSVAFCLGVAFMVIVTKLGQTLRQPSIPSNRKAA